MVDPVTTTPAAPKFKRKKLLTRPVLKMLKDIPVYIRFEGKIYLGKEMKQKSGEDKKKEPAHLADVVDLDSGELAQIIVNAVPMSVLMENYPDNDYVGKCFAITRQGRKEGKSYDPFLVEEIEDPNPAAGKLARDLFVAAEKAAKEAADKAAKDAADKAAAESSPSSEPPAVAAGRFGTVKK